jgi:hypothetical protein
MSNGGFLYYDPEKAPHHAAPASMDLHAAKKLSTVQHASRFHKGTLGWYTLPHTLLATESLKKLQGHFLSWLRKSIKLPSSLKLEAMALYNYHARRVDVTIETECGGNAYRFECCFEPGIPELDTKRSRTNILSGWRTIYGLFGDCRLSFILIY